MNHDSTAPAPKGQRKGWPAWDWRRSYGTLRGTASTMQEPLVFLTYTNAEGVAVTHRIEGFDLRGMRRDARQSLRRTSDVTKRLGSIVRLDVTVLDGAGRAVTGHPTATLFPAFHSKSGAKRTKSRKRHTRSASRVTAPASA